MFHPLMAWPDAEASPRPCALSPLSPFYPLHPCTLLQSISTHSLAERLGMDDESTELWIVNLIRGARLNAKIDSKAGTVVMQTQSLTPHEQVGAHGGRRGVRLGLL